MNSSFSSAAKLYWKKFLLYGILIFLFLLPFTWTTNNFFNLGGDDSRIYTSHPKEWFENIALWSWSSAGGFESSTPQQSYVPLVLIGIFIKNILPFLNLQSFLYGFSLSLGFLAVFATLREILVKKDKLSFIVSIIGGLFYIFLPLTFLSFFVNPVKYIFSLFLFPLLFYFFLKALRETEIKYILYGGLISVVFSISLSSIPFLYAFTFGSALFFALHFLLICANKKKFVQYLLTYFAIVLVLNLFWIGPFLSTTFIGTNQISSSLNPTAIENNIGGIRLGAENKNLVDSLLGLLSRESVRADSPLGRILSSISFFSILNFIFPLIIFSGFALVRKKESFIKKKLSILGIVFLILAFLQTVNIGKWGIYIFTFLVKAIPGFISLRNYYIKVAPVYVFFYSLVFGMSLYLILSRIKTIKLKMMFLFFPVAILLFQARVFISGKIYNLPLANGTTLSRNVKLPDAYLDVASYLKKKNDASRVVHLPFTFGTWSIVMGEDRKGVYIGTPLTKVSGGKTSFAGSTGFRSPFFDNLQTVIEDAFLKEDYEFIESVFGFLNVQSIIFSPDIFYSDVPEKLLANNLWSYGRGFREGKYINFLRNLRNPRPVYQSGTFNVYRVSDQYYSPHIYSPERILQLENPTDIFQYKKIFPKQKAPTLYIQKVKSNKTLKKDVDVIKALSVDRYIVTTDCVGCDNNRINQYKLSDVRFLPGSIFYPLIRYKEKRYEKTALNTQDNSVIINLNLGLASKRLEELLELVGKEKYDKPATVSTVERFNKRLNNVLEIAETIDIHSREGNDILLRIVNWLKLYRDTLLDLSTKIPSESKVYFTLSRTKTEIENYLTRNEKKIWVSSFNINRSFVNIPRDGVYELYLQGDRDVYGDLDNFELRVDNQTLSLDIFENGGNEVILKGEKFLTEGGHKIELSHFLKEKVLQNIAFDLVADNYNLKEYKLSVANLRMGEKYRVSFKYSLSPRGRAKFAITQKSKHGVKKKTKEEAVSIGLQNGSIEKKFDIFFGPVTDSRDAQLQFSLIGMGDEINTLSVKDLDMEVVYRPEIVLRSKARSKMIERSTPTIKFIRINPVRYEVIVKNATDPFVLVSLDSFHNGWNLYLSDEMKQENLNGKFAYFNLDFFNTWSKKPIAKKRHFLANGYANGWLIKPEDTGNKQDYKLIIEFWPQRIFYVSALISILGFMVTIGYIGWDYMKQTEK
jgi:hypothetical protein